MIDWHSGDVLANGIQMHYTRSGGTQPPLILLHGATDNGMCWEPVARRLTADFDVVMPDARGHGLSAAPADGYSSAERAKDVAELLAQLGLGRVAVGGHSMGGQTAFRLAVEYPDLVQCVVLEDPPFRVATQAPSDGARWRADVARMQRMSRDELIALGRRTLPLWSDDELPAWADAKLQVSCAYMDSMGQRNEPPWQQLAARLVCPTLLVTADPDKGAIVRSEAAEELRQLNPRIEVTHISGAGHNIRRERFDGFVQAVTTFLAREYARV